MKYTYGINKFEVGDIAVADGALENPVDLTSVIYKDTIKTEEPEATETTHYVENSKFPAVSISEAGIMKVMASLFGATPTQKVALMGGSVTTLNSVDTYNAPKENVTIEKYIKVTLASGHVVHYPRVKVSGRHTGEFSVKGVLITPITFTVLNPSFAALYPLMIQDPA